MSPPSTRGKVVALLGPTASGKTSAAIALAKQFNGEIVSIDSALVYRGMDIGAAKPSMEERDGIPHHLIDLIDPTESYSAAFFRTDALAAISDVHARGKLPILAGGTMLYFKAMRDGIDDLPSADAEIRAEIEQAAREHGWPALHSKLATLDPATAQRLKPNDSQRISRALEIIRVTGEPMSALLKRNAHAPAPLPFDLLSISLEPSDRAVLHQRIAHRFDAMIERGLIDELKELRRRHPRLHPDLPSMRCVGYRQVWEFLENQIDRDALRDKGIAATRQLAKRQITWLRSMTNLTRIDCLQTGLADGPRSALGAIVSHFLEEKGK